MNHHPRGNLPTNHTTHCDYSNEISGPCALYAEDTKVFKNKLARFEPSSCAIFFFIKRDGAIKPSGRGQVVTNVSSRSHMHMKDSGAAYNHRPNTLEIVVHVPENDIASIAASALNPMTAKKPSNKLWAKAKKATEIKTRTLYVSFNTPEDEASWYAAIKQSVRMCTDCNVIYAAATLESSFSWINSNLNKLAKANVTKIGAIGSDQESSARTPTHAGTGSDLQDLLSRYDDFKEHIYSIGEHVVGKVHHAGSFLNFRSNDTEIQSIVADEYGGDHLKAINIFKLSFVCGNSSSMAKIFNLLTSGSTNKTPDSSTVSWTCVKFENDFSPHSKSQREIEGIVYKRVALYLEVDLPTPGNRIIVEADLHLQSMLMCINSASNQQTPLCLYSDRIFIGKDKLFRELVFRYECYMKCATTMRKESLELRPFYIREIEYIHVKEIGFRKETHSKNIDRDLNEASLDLALATVFRRHYSAIANLPMMETKVLPLLSFVEEKRALHLGRSHPLTLQSVNSMALTLKKIKKYDEAEAAYNRSLEALIKNVGAKDLKTANIYHNLGVLVQLKGDVRRAIEYFEKDVEILTEVYGVSHPDTLSSLKHLVKICRPHFKDKVTKYKSLVTKGEMKAHGKGSLEFLEAINQNAESQIESGNSAEAAIALHEALDAFDKRTKGTHEEVDALKARLSCLNNLGIALMMENDVAGATKALQECAGAFASNRQYGPQHSSTVMVMNNLGMLLASQHRDQEAEGCYRRALKGIQPFLQQGSQLGGFGGRKAANNKSQEELAELEEAANVLRANLAMVTTDLAEKVALYGKVLAKKEKKIDAKRHPTNAELVLAMQNLTAALFKLSKTEAPGASEKTRAKAMAYAEKLIDVYRRKPRMYEKELQVFSQLLTPSNSI